MADDRIFDAKDLLGDFKEETEKAKQEVAKELKEVGKSIIADVKQMKQDVKKQVKEQQNIDLGKIEAIAEVVLKAENVDETTKQLATDVSKQVRKAANKKPIKAKTNVDIEIDIKHYTLMHNAKKNIKKSAEELEEQVRKSYHGMADGKPKSAEKFVGHYTTLKESGIDYSNTLLKEFPELDDAFNKLIHQEEHLMKLHEQTTLKIKGQLDLIEQVRKAKIETAKVDTPAPFQPTSNDKSGVLSSNQTEVLSGTVPEQNAQVKEQVKLYDNLGREIDEVNKKLLDGTKHLNEQKELITLFHFSNESFEQFDGSMAGKNGSVYGSSVYLSEAPTFKWSSMGEILSQWYANVEKIFDYDKSSFSDSEIEILLENFGTELDEEATKIVKQKLSTVGNAVVGLNKLSGSHDEMLQALGYDAVRKESSKIFQVFDPKKVIKATDIEFTGEQLKELLSIYETDGIPAVKAFMQEMLKVNSAMIQANQTPLSLHEESSGQLALFEGVVEQQKEIRQSVEQTNDAIEGQIGLVDYLNEQKSKPVAEPIKDTFDEQHTSDIKAETDAIKENTDALKENAQAQKQTSKTKKDDSDTRIHDVNKAWTAANRENRVFNTVQTQKAIKSYEELIGKLERYYSLNGQNNKNKFSDGSVEKTELESLKNQIDKASKSIDEFKGKGKDFNEIVKKFRSRIRELEKDSGTVDLYEGKNSRENVFNKLSNGEIISSKINGYAEKVKDLKTIFLEIEKIVPIDISNQKDIDRLDELNKQFDKLAQDLNSDEYNPANQLDINKWTGKISDTLFKNTNAPKEIRREMEELVEQLKQIGLSQADIRRIKDEFERLESQMKATGKTGDSLGTKIKKKFKDVAAYFATYVSIQDAIQVIRQGFETIKEYDIALTEMNKVSDESIQTLKEFQKESFDLANTIGTTAQQIQNSTADWMRLGESLEDAKQSAQDANILFNVSEFGSIDEATEALVSMSQAYKELEKGEIVDVVNNLGNNFAISTDGLATALQNSASALTTAQNDFYEAAALTTAANTVVQDPDKVGAGLRTIALRLTGTEAAREELQALGEDVDDFVITTTSKLDQQIKDLTKTQGNFGVSLLDMNGNYRSTYEVLLDIAKVWDKIAEEDLVTGENRQNALLEMMAGKNRSNILASVLQSPEVLEEAYAYALESEGSALKENEAYLESIQGHLDQLKNSWDNLWINENNREVITFFLDLAKSILDAVNSFGTLNTLLVGGGGIFAAVKAIKGDGRLKKSSLIFM